MLISAFVSFLTTISKVLLLVGNGQTASNQIKSFLIFFNFLSSEVLIHLETRIQFSALCEDPFFLWQVEHVLKTL